MTTEAPEAPAVSSGPEPGSFESFLQQRRQELREERRVTLPVTGFKGKLVGEYATPPWSATRAIATRHPNIDKPGSQGDEDSLNASVDLLIASCQRLYGVADNGAEIPLPVWGTELAKRFGINVEPNGMRMTERQAVRAIFEGSEMKLATHASEVAAATTEDEEDVDDALMGES